MKLLKDQHVLILGLGISGLSMARWCTRQGALVTVADTRSQPPSLAALQAACPQARFVAGPFDQRVLAMAPWHLIARSPGLLPEQLETACQWAKTHGAAWLGELDLFAQALVALSQREAWPYRPQVLAITGTNGKTTVTSLTALLLARAGWRVAVAGNIGPALLDVLASSLDHEAQAEQAERTERETQVRAAQAQPLSHEMAAEVADPAFDCPPQESHPSDEDGVTQAATEDGAKPEAEELPVVLVPPPPRQPEPPHLPQAWVLELSSFQLDGTAGGAWDDVPTAGTVLNLSEDHLDWHGSMSAYAQAKTAVFGARALMLLNRDDPRVMGMKPADVTVKISGRNRQQPARPWTSFGLGTPFRPGDWGIESLNGMDWLARAVAVDETRKRVRGDEQEEVYFQRLMPADALRIRGRHNAANALSALALASSTGAPLAPMLHGLREYRGEPHRVEPIGLVNEVEYFDDSKGTNVGATLAAVRGLGGERRLVVILGGDGKGQDFAPLAEPLAQHARAVVLIGRDAARIREQIAPALDAASVVMEDAATLPEAVSRCAAQAQPGDAVLLSPACASLDMFENYAHRAQVFIDAVRALAAEQGFDLEVGL